MLEKRDPRQDLEEPDAKAAFVWILGHYGESIQVRCMRPLPLAQARRAAAARERSRQGPLSPDLTLQAPAAHCDAWSEEAADTTSPAAASSTTRLPAALRGLVHPGGALARRAPGTGDSHSGRLQDAALAWRCRPNPTPLST